MMRQFCSFILLLTLLVGCDQEKKPSRPDDLISEDKMVSLLYDIQIINSAKSVNKKLLEIKGVNPEEYIFKKYNIDSARFSRSNEYYSYIADTYEKILDRVQKRMDSVENHYNEIYSLEQEKEKKDRDSLKIVQDKLKDSLVKQGILNSKKLPIKESKDLKTYQ